jgi:hypothetical protein
MTAQVIPIQPYIERRALQRAEQYTPAQFMQEVSDWNAKTIQEMSAFWNAFFAEAAKDKH